MKCPYLQPKKRRIRHHVEYLDSVATATGVLNTIPSSFVEAQQKKIFDRVSKLFAGTVYENKLIQQAKKILREWVRAEQDAQKMRYKLESEKDALKDKLDRQTKILSQLDKLTVENKDLQKQLQSSEVENQLLKNKFLQQQTKTAPK